MDKEYQDIFYEKMEFNSTWNEVVWGVREVHIISILFEKEKIKISYCDTDNKYHKKVLKKRTFYRIVIE